MSDQGDDQGNDQEDLTRKMPDNVKQKMLDDVASEFVKAVHESPSPAQDPAPAPIDEQKNKFLATMNGAIEQVAAIRESGEGFMICSFLEVVPIITPAPVPGGAPPGAVRVDLRTKLAIGGRVNVPLKVALIASLQAIFNKLRELPPEVRPTVADIGEILGLKIQQSRLHLPGSTGFTIPGGRG